jgi:hypothetical protein
LGLIIRSFGELAAGEGAPARTRATSWGALTARQLAWADAPASNRRALPDHPADQQRRLILPAFVATAIPETTVSIRCYLPGRRANAGRVGPDRRWVLPEVR